MSVERAFEQIHDAEKRRECPPFVVDGRPDLVASRSNCEVYGFRLHNGSTSDYSFSNE
jgi:hypothetical protein